MTTMEAPQRQAIQRNAAKPPAQQLTLRNRIEDPAFAQEIAKVLPKFCTPERFVRVLVSATMRTPKLMQCTTTSFFGAALRLAELGIEADGRRAHLIPFENRKAGTVECQLIIDYKGYAELAMRSGVVSYIHADIVCDNDVFEYSRGELREHRINFKQARGKVYAVYALCKFKDGSEKADVMTVEEVEAIRRRSRAGSSGPWVTDWNEMAKKTVFRRMSKWLPLSPEQRDAIDADDGIELSANTVPVPVHAPVVVPSMALEDVLSPQEEQPQTDELGGEADAPQQVAEAQDAAAESPQDAGHEIAAQDFVDALKDRKAVIEWIMSRQVPPAVRTRAKEIAAVTDLDKASEPELRAVAYNARLAILSQ